MSGPRIGELFAGYGGLGMGVQAALGGEMAWYSEIDKGALKILGHRFPGVPNVGDITTVEWSQVEPVDILTGGSPCQDLSHAGKRAGMTEGTRSNLWVAMREAIAQLRPGLVVWENVRGAASASATSDLEPCAGCVGDGPGVHLRALGRVVGDLADLGYVGGWHGLRAADIGAPHGRFRFFLIAYPTGDTGRFQHGDGGLVADALGGGRDGRTPLAGWGAVGRTATQGPSEGALLPTPTSQSAKHDADDRGLGTLDDHNLWSVAARIGNGALLPTPRAGDGEKGGPNQRGSSGDLMLPSAAVKLLPTPTAKPENADDLGKREARKERSREKHGRPFGESLSSALSAEQNWGQYAAAIARWEQISRAAPPPTETGPKGNPRLSAAFSEWLMGLPAGWVTDVPGITRNEALRALGNGVVPQQAEAAIRTIFARKAAA